MPRKDEPSASLEERAWLDRPVQRAAGDPLGDRGHLAHVRDHALEGLPEAVALGARPAWHAHVAQ